MSDEKKPAGAQPTGQKPSLPASDSPLGGLGRLGPGLGGRPFPKLPKLGQSSAEASAEKQAPPPPAASEAAPSKPAASKPAASKPAASKAPASKPAASKPAAPEPAASKPAPSKPAASKPAASKPAAPAPATPRKAAVEPASGDIASAVVIELGKQKRKRVRRLREGDGRLMESVLETMDALREEGVVAEDAQPVFIVVERKRKKDRDWMI